MHLPTNAPKLLLASIAAVLAAALAIAGCGGGSSGGGGGDPASLAPVKAPVYLEVSLKPDSKTSEALNELTGTVFGIENLGEFVAEELEKASLGEGQKFDFETEVEPWLGEKAGMYLNGYEGEEFHGYGAAIETTDSGEAEEFIEKRVEADGSATESEFEGHKYYVEPEDETVLGMIGDYVAFAESKADFEEMVKASESEGLNESAKFKETMEAAPSEGIGNVYFDIGGLIEQGKGQIPPETEAGFAMLQIEPKKATAVASVIPHTEQLEIDVSSNIGKTVTGAGDASQLLESLPATADAGFAAAEFGKSFTESIHTFSEQGIPGQLEPGQLEGAFEAMGINLKSLGESLGDVGGFLEGSSEGSVGGAIVVETSSPSDATNMVGNLGLLLKATQVKGVTEISGKVTGFAIHSAELGRKPLIIGAAGEKLVIAYGTKAAAQALRSQTKTLGQTPDFEAGKSALGSTPISVFVDGGPTLKLVEALLPSDQQAKFSGAKPYLQKIAYLAIGGESQGKSSTSKVIVGLQK